MSSPNSAALRCMDLPQNIGRLMSGTCAVFNYGSFEYSSIQREAVSAVSLWLTPMGAANIRNTTGIETEG
jgi:hypothetical protein